jgi:hypothetical protein
MRQLAHRKEQALGQDDMSFFRWGEAGNYLDTSLGRINEE